MFKILVRLFRRKKGLGWKPNKADDRDLKYKAVRADLPAEMSLRKWAEVVDQKSTSSCVGNAVAGAVRIAENRSGHEYGYPSRMFIYYIARLKREKPPLSDDGTYIRDAFKQLGKLGVPDEKYWPFKVKRVNDKPAGFNPWAKADPRKDGEYLAITGTGDVLVQRIKTALNDGHAVVFGTQLAKSFMASNGPDVIDRPGSGDTLVGGHAMVIIGYRTQGGSAQFEVMNSWGTRWRDGGFCWFTERYITWGKTWDFTIVRGWKRLRGAA